jgi:uncharacterized membrane protein
MPIALFLVIGRLTTPVPRGKLYGIYQITTAPGSLSVLIWSLLHLLNVGEDRTVVVFAAMAAIAAVATLKNAKLAWRTCPEGAVIPLLAVLSGHTQLRCHEIGWVRPLLTGLIYVALIYLHPLVIGPDPLTGL